MYITLSAFLVGLARLSYVECQMLLGRLTAGRYVMYRICNSQSGQSKGCELWYPDCMAETA
jgi:hypothetical protein